MPFKDLRIVDVDDGPEKALIDSVSSMSSSDSQIDRVSQESAPLGPKSQLLSSARPPPYNSERTSLDTISTSTGFHVRDCHNHHRTVPTKNSQAVAPLVGPAMQ